MLWYVLCLLLLAHTGSTRRSLVLLSARLLLSGWCCRCLLSVCLRIHFTFVGIEVKSGLGLCSACEVLSPLTSVARNKWSQLPLDHRLLEGFWGSAAGKGTSAGFRRLSWGTPVYDLVITIYYIYMLVLYIIN